MRRLFSMSRLVAAFAGRPGTALFAALAVSLAAAFALFAAGVARSEVAVVEEEVVFTILAPAAASVYLAGDFNNWNPTIEKMNKTGGKFEVRLFLLPGKYRYKFVVDGNWIADPDNPGADPAKGSPLELQERSGMLVLGAAEESEEEVEEKLRPSVRYSGPFLVEDGKTRSDQALDFWLNYKGKNVGAQVDFKTTDESWDLSPLRAEVLFDRGHIDLRKSDAGVKAFENDSTWASADPFHLFGNVGVYGYDAGFERRGFAIETPPLLKTKVRGVYSDFIGARPGPPPTIESAALDGFAGSAAPDTVVYRYEDTYEDEDTWGFDLAADAGSLDLGYARRWNRGFHPGALAGVTRRETDFDVAFYTTREFWDGDTGWLRWGALDWLGVTAGFGRATAVIRTNDASTSVIEAGEDITLGAGAVGSDIELPLQKSGRWTGGLDFAKNRWRANAVYSWAEYEFERGVYAASKARVGELSIDALYQEPKWSARASLRAVDQDYGSTPADFHAATPRRNFWLDTRDRLTVADMVSFDLERCVHMSVGFERGERTLSKVGSVMGPGEWALLADAGATTNGFFGTLEYAYLRAAFEYAFPEGFFAELDARAARYRKSSWGLEDSFFAGYIECGYRNRWAEASLGFGLDPVVLDPVVNLYADIGREEYLRAAIPGDLTRETSGEMGERLGRQEALLEDLRVVKLEVILSF
jgi:hypothetical protein